MSRASVIRKSFNGGEIAPELRYRSDLETYHNSCKSLKNMLVTPWGTSTKRSPTKLLSQIDTATYGVPVKYLPFRFSLTEIFHIVFTDGSGSASPDSSTADLIVLGENGTIQVLEGASTFIINTPYNISDLDKVHHIQVNDFIYMTCGGLYPEYYILRSFDKIESANRWRLEANELSGGPFEEQNEDESDTLFAKVQNYDTSVTYSEGDVVYPSNIISITGGGLDLYIGGSSSNKWNRVRVDLSSAYGGSIGDSIEIEGLYLSSPGNKNYYTKFFPPPAYNVRYEDLLQPGDRLEGVFVITKIEGNSIVIDKTVYSEESSGYVAPVFATDPNANLSSIGVDDSFYKSLQNSNTGNALTNASFWETLEFYEGEVSLVASNNIFTSTDVGREVAILIDNASDLRGDWVVDTTSEAINAQGTMTLETSNGAWGGLLELQVSYNSGGTWITLGSIRSVNGNYNGTIERTVTNVAAIVRVKLTDFAFPTDNFITERCQWTLRFSKPVRAFFRINSYIDERNVTALTRSPLFRNFSDYRWELGAFSETTGYPKTLAIHDERKVYGGNNTKPNTVWASRINDWTNFLEGDLDTSPYTFTVKSDSFDSVRWIRSVRDLIIGTDNSETTMASRDSAQAITPTNIDVRTQTYFGSTNLQAVVTADLLFFVQGQGGRVRSTQYDFGTDQYLSSEMSILAHHITEPGIKEMSFRRHPYSTIFFVLENGKAVSFTYERDNQVKGWSRVEVGGSGTIVSAASNYCDSGDIVAGIVKRGSTYSLETFGNVEDDTVYLDSQLQFVDQDYSAGVSVPWSAATGLTVIRNDVELEEGADYTISAGTLTIPAHTDGTVTVGYKFDWEIEPTDIVNYGDFGLVKRVSKLSLYLLQSGGCTVAVNGKESPFKASLKLSATDRLDGEYEITTGGGYDTSIGIKLSGNDHKPFKLSAIGLYATN